MAKVRRYYLYNYLNHVLNMPKLIKKQNGKVVVQTCKPLIENGEVLVNSRRVYRVDHVVQTGDMVRWGLIRNKEFTFVK